MTDPNWRLRPKADATWWCCSFERDNPEPAPVKCDCPYCECTDDYAGPVLPCTGGSDWLVQLEDGNYYSCCCADAHGLGVVWAGERYRYPQRASIYDQMYWDLYPEDRIEARTQVPVWLSVNRPGSYGVIQLD